jgi:hypothetical protein
MSDAEHSPIDFDLRNIFEPDESPIGIGFLRWSRMLASGIVPGT